mgnify:FL=1
MHIRLKDLTYPAIALVVALLLRYLVVESTDLALHCDMHRWEGWCGVRTALVLSFFRQDLGWVALVLSLLACWRQGLLMARLSLALAVAGLILYSYEPAAVAALVAAMLLARLDVKARRLAQPA